jgi:hypothetical protein
MIRDYIKGAIESKKTDAKKPVGIGEFTAYVSIDESTEYEADIPTETLEDRTSATTDIIIKPLTVKISGEVGDIVVNPDPVTSLQNRVNSELGKVSTYLPAKTQSQISKAASLANDAQDAIRRIDEAIAVGKSAANFFGNKKKTDPPGKQFIDEMERLFYGKQLVQVSVPYKTHSLMAISSMSIQRDNQRGAIAFSIQFKQIVTSQTALADIQKYFKKPAPAAQGKTAPTIDKGPQQPKSFLDFVTGG